MNCFSFPVIDVEKTSLRLKEIREQKNIKISTLQKLFHFDYPQAIYSWENPDKKSLPCIDNIVYLAKLYDVSIDDLIVLKEEKTEQFVIREPSPPYGISKESIEFIKLHASDDVKHSISQYFGFSLQ